VNEAPVPQRLKLGYLVFEFFLRKKYARTCRADVLETQSSVCQSENCQSYGVVFIFAIPNEKKYTISKTSVYCVNLKVLHLLKIKVNLGRGLLAESGLADSHA
jgi:hypothetical protein